MILVWGKARRHRVPNMGYRGAESPGWFDVSAKISAQDVMHEWAHCHDEAANHQLPIAAAAFWIIRIVSMEKCSSLILQYFMQICCFTAQSFWIQWPHNTHAHSMAYTSPTSTVKSSLFMHAHSSPLSSVAMLQWCHKNGSPYINNGWSFSGLTFIYIYICICVCVYI